MNENKVVFNRTMEWLRRFYPKKARQYPFLNEEQKRDFANRLLKFYVKKNPGQELAFPEKLRIKIGCTVLDYKVGQDDKVDALLNIIRREK